MALAERPADSSVGQQAGNRNRHRTAPQDTQQRDPGREKAPGFLITREAVGNVAKHHHVMELTP
jgi:hypothetical protein